MTVLMRKQGVLWILCRNCVGGEIHYHDYWVSKGFIPHSQASLENIEESKVLEIIGELQDDEYYSIDDEYHDLDDGGII